MSVTSHVRIYEINGESDKIPWDNNTLKVHSHWNMNDRVELEYNGVKLVVMADDLMRAIQNGTNHR